MNLSKIVDIAQIIGVVAVVLSLIFIGIQIQQNTSATRAAVRQAVATNDIAYLNTTLNSEIIANANAKIADGKELNTVEREQLVWQQFVNFMIFETVHYNYQEGYIQKELWDRYETIMTRLLSNNIYARTAWHKYENAFTLSFIAEIQRIMKSSNITLDATKFESINSDIIRERIDSIQRIE